MILNVPSNIPYEEIFQLWKNCRLDKRTNLENTVYIILDYLVAAKGLNTLWSEPVGLSSAKFKKICSENFFIVKQELVNRGILIQNLNLGKYEVGVAPEKYNLAFKYCNSGLKRLELPDSSSSRNYKKLKQEGYLHKINLNEGKDVQHLIDQFKILEIEILPEIHDFKSSYQDRLQYYLIENSRKKVIKYLILSKMGQMEQNVEDLYNRSYNPNLNPQNLRFHSLFTNMIKELRSFVRINGNELIEFDLKSSNLYVLATILNHNFFNKKEGKYNLYRIFRKLHIKLENLKEARGEEPNTPGRGGARERKIPYLCPTFFDRPDVTLFKKVSFEEGFYEQLIELVRNEHPGLLKKHPKLGNRDSVKTMVLSFLMDTEKRHRKHMAIVELMERVFPSICEYVSSNLVYRNFRSPMPYLLQRAESFLVLDLVAKELIKSFPNSTLLTIHDCFLMEDAALDRQAVIQKIKQVLFDFTGITPGIAIKTSNPMLELVDSVDKVVKKLERRSRVKEHVNDSEEKRLFSPAMINLVEKGICFHYYGEERVKALEEFKVFINNRYPFKVLNGFY